MSSSEEKNLFCFEFFIESIEMISDSVNVQSMEIKFKCWNNIGKRCYFINETNFLNQMATDNIRIRAICSDQSIYSCNVSLGSFHGTKDSVNCKGKMKLYPMDKSLKNLHVHVVMCIFNMDHIMHPTIFNNQSILAVNRNIQTDCYRINQKTQTGVAMRNATVQHQKTKNKRTQVKEQVKYVTTKDAAVQLSTRISQQQMTKIIAEIISQVLKADKKKQESRKYPGKKLSIIDKNLNRIKIDNPSGKTIGFSKKPKTTNMQYFNEAQKKAKYQRLHSSRLANLNDNRSKCNAEKLCSKSGITDVRDQRYANIINNRSSSYNVICRRELLNKLDRLIAQKMIILRKIRMTKSADRSDQSKNSKQKIERLCRISSSANPSNRSAKQMVDMKLSAGKNTAANILMLDDNWLSTKFKNQNLTQKSSSSDKSDNDSNKNSDYSAASSSKLAPSLTATTSDYTSGSSTVRNLTEKFKKDLITEMHKNSNHKTSDSDPKMISNNSIDISSDKNNADNGNNTSSTARTVSSEFSSEASTITELQSIK